jgi:nicotinamide mononucleotide (NMN) deamidase PncC
MAEVSGCGKALQMGYVVYTEEAKNSCLGVSLETIQAFGLTSEETAREMATGALARSAANLIVAIPERPSLRIASTASSVLLLH